MFSVLEIECPLPDVPANANVTHSAGRYVGEKAVYVCQHGYDLVGSNIRVCQSDGSWSLSTPQCISKLYQDFHMNGNVCYFVCII